MAEKTNERMTEYDILEIRGPLKQAVVEERRVGGAPDLNLARRASFCSVHRKKEELYCEVCHKLVCLKCTFKGGEHHDHDCSELIEAFDKYKREITSALEPIQKQLSTINTALAHLDSRGREILDQKADVEANIHDTVRQLHMDLDLRKIKLVKQLHEITQAKLKDLAVQRSQLETLQAQLSSCLTLTKESLKNGGEMLKMKKAKELTAAFQLAALKPYAKADSSFLFSTDVGTACQNYGMILCPTLPDPSKCVATGPGLKSASVGEVSTFDVQIVDFTGQPCNSFVQSLEYKIVSEVTGVKVQAIAERMGLSQYRISYQPTTKGKYQLCIKIAGQHIRGSPFTVAVKSRVEKLGPPINAIQGLNEPYGIAFNQRGDLVVAEKGANCISVFSPRGERLLMFGSHGRGQGKLMSPRGITVDRDGNVLVVDGGNHCIQKFSSEGQFLAAAGTKGSGRLQFDIPYDIAFNSVNNKMYVVDANHRVQILNSDLTLSGCFGKRGSGKGQFEYPYGIACDNSGKVYVADSYNHRIQVFTTEGKFLRTFGRHFEGRGELRYPFGIAVDSNCNVYISEMEHHCISVFTSDGRFVTSFGRRGAELGEFKSPWGLTVDSNGIVYVCSYHTGCIQMF